MRSLTEAVAEVRAELAGMTEIRPAIVALVREDLRNARDSRVIDQDPVSTAFFLDRAAATLRLVREAR